MSAILFSHHWHGMLIILAAIQTFILSTDLNTQTLFIVHVQWTRKKLSYLVSSKTDL